MVGRPGASRCRVGPRQDLRRMLLGNFVGCQLRVKAHGIDLLGLGTRFDDTACRLAVSTPDRDACCGADAAAELAAAFGDGAVPTLGG